MERIGHDDDRLPDACAAEDASCRHGEGASVNHLQRSRTPGGDVCSKNRNEAVDGDLRLGPRRHLRPAK
jgi:hypothetical protein